MMYGKYLSNCDVKHVTLFMSSSVTEKFLLYEIYASWDPFSCNFFLFFFFSFYHFQTFLFASGRLTNQCFENLLCFRASLIR